jgi:hypothetical protein
MLEILDIVKYCRGEHQTPETLPDLILPDPPAVYPLMNTPPYQWDGEYYIPSSVQISSISASFRDLW